MFGNNKFSLRSTSLIAFALATSNSYNPAVIIVNGRELQGGKTDNIQNLKGKQVLLQKSSKDAMLQDPEFVAMSPGLQAFTADCVGSSCFWQMKDVGKCMPCGVTGVMMLFPIIGSLIFIAVFTITFLGIRSYILIIQFQFQLHFSIVLPNVV